MTVELPALEAQQHEEDDREADGEDRADRVQPEGELLVADLAGHEPESRRRSA